MKEIDPRIISPLAVIAVAIETGRITGVVEDVKDILNAHG